jgi:hypothetical protein
MYGEGKTGRASSLTTSFTATELETLGPKRSRVDSTIDSISDLLFLYAHFVVARRWMVG